MVGFRSPAVEESMPWKRLRNIGLKDFVIYSVPMIFRVWYFRCWLTQRHFLKQELRHTSLFFKQWQEGPVNVGCTSADHPITSGSPIGVSEQECAPIAVNRLGCTTYNSLWSDELKSYRFELSFVCGHFAASFHNATGWSRNCDKVMNNEQRVKFWCCARQILRRESHKFCVKRVKNFGAAQKLISNLITARKSASKK